MADPKEQSVHEEQDHASSAQDSNVREINTGNKQQEESTTYTQEDIEKNKAIAALAYLIFFLPLLAAQDSSYARFHANQGLLLFILGFGGNTILTIIPILGWIIIPFFSLFVIILGVMGILNAINGKAKDLPLIGQYRILK
ncbi:hypothetical protein [Isachenkonia alkalipeptolytica]|uniref:hypothetical protein n=1 Tax=Isachenkonia alkalipeptolytica TaxID=2565777 RepID=UPI001FD91951|nr:hypothetical protein [Isachenkonia alkalipeptolytica]